MEFNKVNTRGDRRTDRLHDGRADDRHNDCLVHSPHNVFGSHLGRYFENDGFPSLRTDL